MAMTIGADEGPMIEINTTPLIDVLLVLLIMLIITLPAMTHAIKLDMPTVGPGDPPRATEVLVEYDGTVLWQGEPVVDMRELENKLRSLASSSSQPSLNVRADRRSRYDTVAQVLAIAQRSGIKAIGIEGTP
jgi:biopolymer transport protein ExbD